MDRLNSTISSAGAPIGRQAPSAQRNSTSTLLKINNLHQILSTASQVGAAKRLFGGVSEFVKSLAVLQVFFRVRTEGNLVKKDSEAYLVKFVPSDQLDKDSRQDNSYEEDREQEDKASEDE